MSTCSLGQTFTLFKGINLFNRVDVSGFQKAIIPGVYGQPILYGMIVLLEHQIVSKFQPSSSWFEVKLKNFEVILLHYFISFVQFTTTTGSKTAPEQDSCLTAGTLFLDVEASPYSSKHVSCLCDQKAQSLSHLTIKLLPRWHLGFFTWSLHV